MNYIKSKYAFPVTRKLPNNKEVCLLFSGRTGKNIYVSTLTYHKIMRGEFNLLNDEVRETLIAQKILVPMCTWQYEKIEL